MALTNFDENQFDDDQGLGTGGSPEPEKKPGNRTFLLAIGILGVIFILSLVLLLLVAPKMVSQQNAQRQEQAAQINAANTATAAAATAARQQQLATAVKTAVPPTATKAPTKTPVVVVQANTPVPTGTQQLSAAEMATVSALQTQMAGVGGAGMTGTPQATSTALPSTGFADEVGLPGMVGLAAVMVVVILLARKLRLSPR